MHNPYVLGLATAVFTCCPEAAVMQLQKTDSFNSDGFNLPCKAYYLLKFDIPNEN